MPCRLCRPAGQVLGLNPRLFDEGFVIDPSRVRGCCKRHGCPNIQPRVVQPVQPGNAALWQGLQARRIAAGAARQAAVPILGTRPAIPLHAAPTAQLAGMWLLHRFLQEVVIDKPQTGSLSNTSTLILSQPNLFLPGTFVTITNT